MYLEDYGPSKRITSWGTIVYRMHGIPHRENGPAKIFKTGTKIYMIRGLLHREDGPAIEYGSGDYEYWLNGKYLKHEEWKEICI